MDPGRSSPAGAPGGRVAHYESLFRQLTPLFLLGLLLAVAFERWLPYVDWLHEHFGETIVLRAAIVFLIGYVLLLWGESLRLHGLLTGLLEAFRQFGRERANEAGGGTAAVRNPQARLEAAKLLIAAMRSPDASIRATSHANLQRLVGRDLGQDPDAWQRWIEQESPKP